MLLCFLSCVMHNLHSHRTNNIRNFYPRNNNIRKTIIIHYGSKHFTDILALNQSASIKNIFEIRRRHSSSQIFLTLRFYFLKIYLKNLVRHLLDSFIILYLKQRFWFIKYLKSAFIFKRHELPKNFNFRTLFATII